MIYLQQTPLFGGLLLPPQPRRIHQMFLSGQSRAGPIFNQPKAQPTRSNDVKNCRAITQTLNGHRPLQTARLRRIVLVEMWSALWWTVVCGRVAHGRPGQHTSARAEKLRQLRQLLRPVASRPAAARPRTAQQPHQQQLLSSRHLGLGHRSHCPHSELIPFLHRPPAVRVTKLI